MMACMYKMMYVNDIGHSFKGTDQTSKVKSKIKGKNNKVLIDVCKICPLLGICNYAGIHGNLHYTLR